MVTEPTPNGERILTPAQSKQLIKRRLDSRQLLGSGGRIEIEHRGEIYRLAETRQGKLILTK
jgi:hemin uptake protein HemP